MQQKTSIISTVQKYYLFQFFGNLAFFSPVIVLFWRANGLSMAQIMLLQSIYAVGVSIFELPTGAFADYFGKKHSLCIGALFWTMGMIWYGYSHSFWQFALGEITVGVGAAFISGADRAYLHYILRLNNDEKSFNKVEGKARGFIQIAQAVASLAGGFIGSFSLAATLFATSISNFINVLLVPTFPPIRKESSDKIHYFKLIKDSIFTVLTNREILWYTLFFGLFNALVWPLQFYAQEYLRVLQLPVYFFGITFMMFNVLAAVGLAFTHQFDTAVKEKSFFILSIVSSCTLLTLMMFPSIYILPLWSLFLIAAFMIQTIISGRVLQIVPHEKAATVLSIQNLLRRLIYALIIPFLGMITDSVGMRPALMGYSFLMFGLLGFLIIIRKSFK
ncbi:hypothetical protein COY90_01570 [Candidatus Roizmanbacteria bacterium CG_4_10_14_0_8_um_filter_39_9]|uniref:Major facilitator superfamily (MFS) profile domain-containing protein n=1 Tax=Candidatus Roizmanbacteria bacterium CG_4_10_14_0_8_um_filter_39_9 TaxID=1974829 RepID=A0A2M7QEH6_9BACT|nr:MAG: hypothetical protein COY90_01570 [Candidatus Roizmanbacteria bacterium CG_4_10_14_0_8_um_filter_39_9]